MKAVTSGL